LIEFIENIAAFTARFNRHENKTNTIIVKKKHKHKFKKTQKHTQNTLIKSIKHKGPT